jgi:hypothetical protein
MVFGPGVGCHHEGQAATQQQGEMTQQQGEMTQQQGEMSLERSVKLCCSWNGKVTVVRNRPELNVA